MNTIEKQIEKYYNVKDFVAFMLLKGGAGFTEIAAPGLFIDCYSPDYNEKYRNIPHAGALCPRFIPDFIF